jgi:hypothetical protein
VAFRRLSGGVSLQVVISIISEICLQHIHNFIVVHFISQQEIGEKKLTKITTNKVNFQNKCLFFLCFHGYKNILSNSWPVTNKVLLIPNDLILFISYVKITFKYTGCAIFFNSKT